ncbi:hypothetical protein OH77DRAFT_1461428 [Trametes cingulata]|nr:hypothetical protein OH77DRAFT_1461428 [Trametes cingulata]
MSLSTAATLDAAFVLPEHRSPSLPSLHALGQISPPFADTAAAHLDSALNSALRSYVNNPAALRSTMRLLRAVISGSFALSFLLQGQQPHFEPRDLDIYVPLHYGQRMASYLIDVEGFVLHRHREVPYAAKLGHAAVLTLQKATRRIDIVVSMNESALYPISHFWGSHVMNYLSADGYCVAYPELTFSGRGILSPFHLTDHRYPSDYTLSLMAKYSPRGFSFRVRPYAWETSTTSAQDCNISPSAGCPRVRRFFGDRFCLTGTLSSQYAGYGYDCSLPSSLTVCWWRGGDPCGGTCMHSGLLPERTHPTAEILHTDSLPRDL